MFFQPQGASPRLLRQKPGDSALRLMGVTRNLRSVTPPTKAACFALSFGRLSMVRLTAMVRPVKSISRVGPRCPRWCIAAMLSRIGNFHEIGPLGRPNSPYGARF
jgi:hypothetical protein